MEEKDLIEQIKTAYNNAEKMLRVLPEEIGTTVRKTLEGAVRLFWAKKFQNERMPSLYEALTDERFFSCFDEFVISDMHAIRKIGNSGNGGAHLSSKNVFLPKAEDLLARLKACIKAIEEVLEISIITPKIDIAEFLNQNNAEKKTISTPPNGNSVNTPVHKADIDVLQKTKNIVLRFMQKQPNCAIMARGLTQADIFRYCGFGWGNQENATESNQQYWIVACLKELESEKLVQQDVGTKHWRLTKEGEAKTVEVSEFSGLKFSQVGVKIREQSKNIVLDYMKLNDDCARYGKGLRQAELFRVCGFDWGDYEKAEPTRQQYWVIGLLRTLEGEGVIQRDNASKKWRLL